VAESSYMINKIGRIEKTRKSYWAVVALILKTKRVLLNGSTDIDIQKSAPVPRRILVAW